MDACLKTLAAFLVFFYSKNVYASPNEQNIKAFTLCQSSTGFRICNLSCKERADEKILKIICQCDCLFNESLRCVEIEGKYVRFCYDNQVCLPGTHDKVIKIDGFEDKIFLTIEECPDGYFQPQPTMCSKSCSYRHVTRPSNMVQLYPGSASASEVAYCDSGQGWVSLTGRTFFNISLEAGSRMCRKTRDLCLNGSDLLPNGTCAVTCRPGHNREPADQFNCKSGIRQSSVVPDIPVTTTQKQEPDPTEKEQGQQPTHDTDNVQWTFVTLMVITGVVVCTIALFGAVIYFNRRERRETKVLSISGAEVIELLCQQDSKPKTVQTIRKETNKTLNHGCTNITAENVVLYQKGNDDDEDEEETQPKVIA